MATLILDIGSGSVGGAIAQIKKDSPPVILYTARSAINPIITRDATRLKSNMLSSLGEIANQILHEGVRALSDSENPTISEAFVSFSAPWVSSRIASLRFRADRPFEIRESLFSKLRDDEARLPFNSEKIEEKLLRVSLNGYEVGDPFGKSAKEAEFLLFQSFAERGFAGQVEETLWHYLHVPKFGAHSFSIAAYAGISEIFSSSNDFLIIDVSGEQTEISFIRDKTFEKVTTIPFGRNQLWRSIVAKSSLRNIGESSLSLFVEKKGGGKSHKRDSIAIKAALMEWGRAVRSSIDGSFFQGEAVYLLADNDIASSFALELKEGFEVLKIDSDIVRPFATIATNAEPDPFIVLLALAARQLFSR